MNCRWISIIARLVTDPVCCWRSR